jgi:16S rRNA (guanine966-N2)-methyltransferase
MGYIEGARVLDLFSGTGNLAIECLSRGAAWVDIVENHRKSLDIIRQNLTALKITEDFKVHAEDAFRFIQKYEGPAYDVVLADPPFTESYAHDLATQIGASRLLASGSVLVIEASSKERMDESYPGLNRLDRRTFGDKHLNFFEKADYAQGNISR